ncbi:YchF/TatD family DNA exonuclease [bacterium]|nr:YchF/TatD family DNA exonuclease [bacterium]
MKIIDTHAHLDFPQFDQDRDEVIQRAKDAGIEYIVNIGATLVGSRNSFQLSLKYDNIYAVVGISPHDAKEYDGSTEQELINLARQPEVVAIGEIGLDFYRNLSPHDIQREVFIRQMDLAVEHELPFVLHCRNAIDPMFEILESSYKEHIRNFGALWHCFSGNAEDARKATLLGIKLAFGGTITYPKNQKGKEALEAIKYDDILLETDSPYLAPEPFRGKRNEPSYLTHIIEKIAEIKKYTPEDLARITTLNAKKFFGIGSSDQSDVITYLIGRSVYLNITNECSNNCIFCVRGEKDFLRGHFLWLSREPEINEIIRALSNLEKRDILAGLEEVVFCGYGEPTLRMDAIIAVSNWLKKKGMKIRLNTNGHGCLINNRNILPELSGLIDVMSVSLNAENAEFYNKICRPDNPERAYNSVKDFILESKKYISEVVATVVDIPEIDLYACRNVAEKELGVKFRIRSLGGR